MSYAQQIKEERELSGDAFLGVEVSWSFGNGKADAVKVDRKKVAEIFERNGYNFEDITIEKAMMRARRMVSERQGVVVKKMITPKGTPLAFGIYKQTKGDETTGDKFELMARVRVAQGVRAVARPPEGRIDYPAGNWKNLAETFAQRANDMIDFTTNKDISDALLEAGWSQYWLNRRRVKGGVYFLPVSACEGFVNILDELEALTAHFHRSRRFFPQVTEMFARPRTLKTWGDAAVDDFETDVKRLVDDLEKIAAEGMRGASIERRADECDALMKKAERYSMFLSDATDGVLTNLGKLKQAFGVALDKKSDEIERELDEIRALIAVDEDEAPEAVETPEPSPGPVAAPATVEDLDDTDLDSMFSI
jgi:hypothetical protein